MYFSELLNLPIEGSIMYVLHPMCLSVHPHCFNGHFPGEPVLASCPLIIRDVETTPCPRKKQATLIFTITSPSVEIFLQFLKHFVQEEFTHDKV